MAGNPFYYVTYKYVLLKDARLGVLYYALAGLVVLYSVVEIFVHKGYMHFDTRPQGTVKIMLSDEFANESFSSADLNYCRGDTPCRYIDPWDLNWPVESRAVTVLSYAKDKVQRLQSSTNSPTEEYVDEELHTYFTQGPEYVVLKIDHAVVATDFTDSRGRERVTASHREIRGFLSDVDGDIVRELSPEMGKPDKVTLRELMEAAGLDSLDIASDAVNAKGRTFRERGLILRVTIFYENWYSTWFGTSTIQYTYHVRRVPTVDHNMKQSQPLALREEVLARPTSQAPWRLLKKRYSIRVEFEQAGSLGMFSLPMLLLKLVSAVGLLTLTATVIDILALYILPDRTRYRKSVYDESPLLRPSLRRTDKQE